MSKGSQSESAEKLKQKNPRTFSSKALLDEFFRKKNLGSLSFKIATMGNKGKERWSSIVAFLQSDNQSFQIFSHNNSRQCTIQDISSDLFFKRGS